MTLLLLLHNSGPAPIPVHIPMSGSVVELERPGLVEVDDDEVAAVFAMLIR